MTHHSAEHRSREMNECIRACTECHAVCLETITWCLDRGGEHAAAAHIALMATCADICATSAAAMLRGTEAHRFTCGACAEVCRACAAECAKMDGAEMARCAEACTRCAEQCAAMAA